VKAVGVSPLRRCQHTTGGRCCAYKKCPRENTWVALRGGAECESEAQATAEGEAQAERRATAPVRSHRPTSTTPGLTRGALAVPSCSPCEAMYTGSAGVSLKSASTRSGSIRWPDAPPW